LGLAESWQNIWQYGNIAISPKIYRDDVFSEILHPCQKFYLLLQAIADDAAL
jgi:hypothetical protein